MPATAGLDRGALRRRGLGEAHGLILVLVAAARRPATVRALETGEHTAGPRMPVEILDGVTTLAALQHGAIGEIA
jgi:hypothetical protein